MNILVDSVNTAICVFCILDMNLLVDSVDTTSASNLRMAEPITDLKTEYYADGTPWKSWYETTMQINTWTNNDNDLLIKTIGYVSDKNNFFEHFLSSYCAKKYSYILFLAKTFLYLIICFKNWTNYFLVGWDLVLIFKDFLAFILFL